MEKVATQKPVNTIVLDTGPIIKNEPSISTLLAQSEELVTVPAVISEIRDAATRSRIETMLLPFLTQRTPREESLSFVKKFSRKTGDLSVLSQPDLQILALSYELECEFNGGDWRLRNEPGQKRMNGAPPSRTADERQTSSTASEVANSLGTDGTISNIRDTTPVSPLAPDEPKAFKETPRQESVDNVESTMASAEVRQSMNEDTTVLSLAPTLNSISISEDSTSRDDQTATRHLDQNNLQERSEIQDQPIQATSDDVGQEHSPESLTQEDSDSEGWITPSNIKKHQTQSSPSQGTSDSTPQTLQVAVLTSDYAMQNVALQMNLNLLSPSLTRIQHIKTFILRCHACFATTKDTSRQFCPRCGGATLTRVSCSTNARGEFKMHLKKNMQWNNRGNRYSIPKPVSGSANGRVQGGGKGSWGNDLVLAEDQKEYQRAVAQGRRTREKDLLDEDSLPGILTGERNGKTGGRVKVGAGRNVNSKRRS
ncbi:MAG: Nin1 binding protein [Bogoriella megaspora]|nr:MAG: Nin1 binding protein [Bogoriella megaspora]